MRNILIPVIVLVLLVSGTLLGGCARKERQAFDERESVLANLPFVYKMPVQQGNILTEEMVDRLEPGMTRAQVRYLLGTPLIADMFHTDRWDYIYTFRKGQQKKMERKRLTIWFEDDALVRVDGYLKPNPARALSAEEDREIVVKVPDYKDQRGIFRRSLGKVGLEPVEEK
jgi:outer membrane protein assembly factor BamE